MTVFNAFFKTMWRKRASIIIYVIIFTIISVIMSNFSSSNNTSFNATKLEMTIFDYDNSPESQALCSYLKAHNTIKDLPDDTQVLTDELFNRNICYVLRIQKGFSEDYNKLENIKATNSTTASLGDNQINNFIKIMSAYSQNDSYSANEIAENALKSAEKSTAIDYENSSNDNKHDTKFYFFLYLPYLFIAMCITGLGGILLIFSNPLLSQRIQCSCMSLFKRNLLLTACCILFGVIVWFIFMIVGTFLMKSFMFSDKGILFIINSIVIMIFSLVLTFLISFIAESNTMLSIFSNVLGLGMSFLCGIFVPLEVMSPGVKNFAHYLPVYWYVDNCNFIDSYTTGTSLNTFYNDILIQMLFCGVFFALALVMSKIRKKA